MKKLSLLVGTLGGAFAGYLFSNKKLRDQLANAKDPEAAAKLLGKHLQQDGKRLAGQVREFIGSDEVQKNVEKARKFASQKMKEAKEELDEIVQKTPLKQRTSTQKKLGKTATRKPARMKTRTRTLS
ncbi:MAG: hypothetical protein PHO92_01515 [Candidatus Peribacteraceae bacterium]|nr:hypothetical protein [Candidatus Peribacteraceae bacterium]